MANFSPGFRPGTGSKSNAISCCHLRFVGSRSSACHAASKSSTCMKRNKSCSLLNIEYFEIPTSFNLASNAGHTFLCAESYSSSLPALIRKRNATRGIWTSKFPWCEAIDSLKSLPPGLQRPSSSHTPRQSSMTPAQEGLGRPTIWYGGRFLSIPSRRFPRAC